jgi:hypothetical protein
MRKLKRGDIMKKISKYLVSAVEIIIDIALIPLYFVKMFHEVAVLPGVDADGIFITGRFDYYYSPLENLQYDSVFLIYIAIGLLAVSVMLAIATMIKDNKKLRIINYIVFAIAVLFAVFVILLASTVTRCY